MDIYGIFDMHTNLGVCCTHEEGLGEGGGGQVSTRVDSEGQKRNFFSPRPARGSNSGSSDLNSDALTTDSTEPRPPVVYFLGILVCAPHAAIYGTGIGYYAFM